MTTRYTEDHEWLDLDGDIVTVGITEHAAEQLGDIVFIELPGNLVDGLRVIDIQGKDAYAIECPAGGNNPFGADGATGGF